MQNKNKLKIILTTLIFYILKINLLFGVKVKSKKIQKNIKINNINTKKQNLFKKNKNLKNKNHNKYTDIVIEIEESDNEDPQIVKSIKENKKNEQFYLSIQYHNHVYDIENNCQYNNFILIIDNPYAIIPTLKKNKNLLSTELKSQIELNKLLELNTLINIKKSIAKLFYIYKVQKIINHTTFFDFLCHKIFPRIKNFGTTKFNLKPNDFFLIQKMYEFYLSQLFKKFTISKINKIEFNTQNKTFRLDLITIPKSKEKIKNINNKNNKIKIYKK